MPKRKLNVLALVTDAHGGFGGISQYNRDALEAIASYDTVGRVDVLCGGWVPVLRLVHSDTVPDRRGRGPGR